MLSKKIEKIFKYSILSILIGLLIFLSLSVVPLSKWSGAIVETILTENYTNVFLSRVCQNGSMPINKKDFLDGGEHYVFDEEGYVLDAQHQRVLIKCLDKDKSIYIIYSTGKNKKDETGSGDDIKVFFRVLAEENDMSFVVPPPLVTCDTVASSPKPIPPAQPLPTITTLSATG